MGFRALRVLNEDRVAPSRGFGAHSHRDMEIISYVLAGALAHEDSLGNGSVIRPGDVQRMSAGTGVTHSEFNASDNLPVHFLQIWLRPARHHLPPSYEQRHFTEHDRRGRLCLIASSSGVEGSVTVQQDVNLYAALLAPGDCIEHRLRPGRGAWLQVARGSVSLNGEPLAEGDAAALEAPATLRLTAETASEILLFDLV